MVGTMGRIDDSSLRIVDIIGMIGMIDGIAFQTNTVALTTAVDAVRTGEQGLGFAVDASKVRNLAQRSATAGVTMQPIVDDIGKMTSIVSKAAASWPTWSASFARPAANKSRQPAARRSACRPCVKGGCSNCNILKF